MLKFGVELYISITMNKYIIRTIIFAMVFYAICYTNPQIELLLDSAYHVSTILHLAKQGNAYAYSPVWEVTRHGWHSLWAIILKPFLPLATTSIFKIIYLTQFFIGYIFVYFASYLLVRNLIKNTPRQVIELISGFAAFLYFFSTAFWNFSWPTMYAASYLITMPMAIYLCAWLLDKSANFRMVSWYEWAKVTLISLLIIIFHAAEYAYIFIFLTGLFLSRFNNVSLKYIFIAITLLAVVIVAFMLVKSLGVHFISISDYNVIYAKDHSNHVLPLTEWVSLSWYAAIGLILIAILDKKASINLRNLYLIITYSYFMAFFAEHVEARILFFFEPPYLTARFIYGSMWFIFIPLLVYILIWRLSQIIQYIAYSLAIVGLSYAVYDYSFKHEQKFSLIAKRLIISHDGDYISRVTYANFAKVDSYLKSYDCTKYLFISNNDDINAAIGIAGCNGNLSYDTFGRLTNEQIKQLSLKYKVIQVPELFRQGDNEKYSQLWGIR